MGPYCKFGGQKYKNITVEEMVRFYGILLRMSIEPRHLGGYQAYFKSTTRIDLAPRYVQEFNTYGGWAEEI
eukprot:9852152-Ditylum_brightwellii.AAC.1